MPVKYSIVVAFFASFVKCTAESTPSLACVWHRSLSSRGVRVRYSPASFAPVLPSSCALPRMPPDGNRSSQRAPPAVVRAGNGFSLKEVAQHNTPGDCWLVLRGKVYDVSQWCESAAA